MGVIFIDWVNTKEYDFWVSVFFGMGRLSITFDVLQFLKLSLPVNQNLLKIVSFVTNKFIEHTAQIHGLSCKSWHYIIFLEI